MQRNVLITGCSSGIGRAMAERFASLGHRVFATARKPESIAELKADNVTVSALDVTDSESMRSVVEAMAESAGSVDILVNNAGLGVMGPIVELAPDDLRLQFETNVIGPAVLAQMVAKKMIDHGGGRIVNVGSVSGVMTTPFAGAYCASKAAIHALSDAMRMELAPFDVRVITVQPGGVISKFGDKASGEVERFKNPDSLYHSIGAYIEKRARAGQEGAMKASEFAGLVVRDILSDDPPSIIRYGANSTRLPLYDRLLPKNLTDKMMKKRFGLFKLRR